jgi:uncharacterized membrane protein
MIFRAKSPSPRLELEPVQGAPENQRLTALSDGVFSIVITLLVFSIKLPEVAPDRAAQELPQALAKLTPDLLTLLISFIILGIYWIGHNNIFQHILRHDRFLLWLNIAFLLSVAIIPYPVGLLVRYGETQLAVLLYAGSLIAGSVLIDVIWWYAARNPHLMRETATPQLIQVFHRRILTGPVIYLFAIGLSFFSLLAAKLLFVAAALFYLLPTTQDILHHRQFGAAEQPDAPRGAG